MPRSVAIPLKFLLILAVSFLPTSHATKCYVCGKGSEVKAPDQPWKFPGRKEVTCAKLEEDGLAGDLGFLYCILLPGLIDNRCDCGPIVATPSISPVPSVTPSLRPSLSPTITNSPSTDLEGRFPVLGFLGCFSKHNTVVTENRGTITIDKVRIGDSVLTSGNKFETVYSLGHFSPDFKADFIRIQTTSDQYLEMTNDHLVFDHEHKAIPAASIQRGDKLLLPDGISSTEVLSVRHVKSTGLFAPFTTSGTLVVNGIVASSYVDLNLPLLSGQWIAHTFDMPHRMICSYHLDWCKGETYAPNGIPHWLNAPYRLARWTKEQHVLVQALGFCVAISTLSIMAMTEIFFTHGLFLLAIVLVYKFRRYNYQRHVTTMKVD